MTESKRVVFQSTYLQDLVAKTPTLHPYSFSDIKNTLDDCLCRFLADEHGIVEDHFWTDLKLVVGALTSLLAFAITYYAHITPLMKARNVIQIGVFVYFAVNGLIILLLALFDRGTILRGEKNGLQYEVRVKVQKPSPLYTIDCIVFKNKQPLSRWDREWPKQFKIQQLQYPVSRWFDVHGRFHVYRYCSDLLEFISNAEQVAQEKENYENENQENETKINSNHTATLRKRQQK